MSHVRYFGIWHMVFGGKGLGESLLITKIQGDIVLTFSRGWWTSQIVTFNKAYWIKLIIPFL